MNITPVIKENQLSFVWNVEDIKKQLAEQLEKYQNLVVTEDNYKDMEKTKREIVKYRTAIKNFGTEQKRLLKEPYDKFVDELKDVLLEVDRVEQPLVKQLAYFEEQEQAAKKEKVESIVAEKIGLYGLREEYVGFINYDAKWWQNKTAKLSDVAANIEEQVKGLVQRQQANDDMAKIQAEKRGMLEFAFEMMSDQYDLTTPIEFDALYPVVKNMPLDQAKEYLKAQFEKRLEIELAAKAVKTEPDNTTNSNIVSECDVNDVMIYDLTANELEKLKVYLNLNNLTYEVY